VPVTDQPEGNTTRGDDEEAWVPDEDEASLEELFERTHAELLARRAGGGGPEEGNDFSGTLSIMERYRALPTDLGMANEVIAPPSEMDTVAMEVITRLAQRGWDIINWRGETRVRHVGTHGAYVPLGQGDEHEAIASSLQIAFGGAVRTNAQGDVVPWGTGPSVIDGVTRAVLRRARVDDAIEHNTWVDEQELREAQRWLDEEYPGTRLGERLDFATADQLIQTRSGILWCPEDEEGRPLGRVLLPRSRGLFSTISVAAEYDPLAADGWGGGGEPSRWLEFLEEAWPDDEEQRETLRRWFGYVISGRTDLQKMLIVVGPPRSGKGVIAHVLTQLLGGLSRVDSTTFQRLNEPFGLANAVGKPLMLIPDARVSTGTKMITQRLLSITGEDPLAVNRKHKNELVTRLGCRVMIMSNEMPSLRDASQALAERMIPLRMRVSFVGREDPFLKEKLDAELGGILHWALDGMDLLRSGGRFELGEVGRRELQAIRDDMSPVSAFVREACVVEEGAWVGNDELLPAWCAWVEESGCGESLDPRSFGRKLGSAGLPVESRVRLVGGRSRRGWEGLRLRRWNELDV
jgi:putative DNA primase/helicase